ncbi:MAG: peptidoglycan D,D-transpeptidase FtsI family protein [Bacillota bacterium]
MAKKKKKRAQTAMRLNILFLFVFLLFSLLILQLGVVQILNGEEARERLNETENAKTSIAVPRGLMFDADGELVVDNEPVRSITYTPPKNGDSHLTKISIAEKLATMVMMAEDIEGLNDIVNERDKKEFWYVSDEENRKLIEERLTEDDEELTSGELYQRQLDLITPEDYNSLDWSDDYQLNVVAIKKELDQAIELSPHVIKNEDVTDEEYAQVSEHLNLLPGIDAKIDWNRVYPFEDTFRTFIGNITDADQGIPRDNQDYYLKLGYSWNDRVGESGLEQQYEDVLRGQKEVIQYTIDNDGDIVGTKTVQDGKAGNDLVLTVDMDFQQALDEIVKDELEKYIAQDPYRNRHMEDALVAALDPQTGAVLGMTAAHYNHDEDTFENQPHRVVYDGHIPGSSIKGATVLTGYQTGVIDIGTVLNDRPIKIAGTPIKKSWRNFGLLNDLKALEQSSNVYMFEIAMRIATANYNYNEPLRSFDQSSFQTMRNYFQQFGLGSKTGIDLPFEATGYIGSNIVDGGLLLDFAIGQYDTFTTLQLAQYVSTIANDGYRLAPYLVKEEHAANGNKASLGPVVTSKSPNLLNRIDMDDRYIERVQQGFRLAATEGTGRSNWANNPYDVAVKTGTAQNYFYVDGEEQQTNNLTLVGYAPYDEPEVAFAIVIPRAGVGNDQNGIHHNIGNRLIDAYFDIKEEKANEQQKSTEQIETEADDEDNDEAA